jgi:hypothetical protein
VTITYYIDAATSVATGAHAATREKGLITALPSSNLTDTSGSIAGGASALTHCWTTASGQPNQADWGNGTYRCILDVSAVGADLSFGLRTAGAVTGHFARVDSGLTADQETVAQAEALFTGTGLKTATAAWNPAAGAAGDRFECLLGVTNGGSMNQTIGIDSDTAGVSFTDGPFDAAAAPAILPPFPLRRIPIPITI